MKKITIVGSAYGFFEESIDADLDLTSLSGGSEAEPWDLTGTAYTKEEGRPYLGQTEVLGFPIWGIKQKYTKVWRVTLTKDGWIGQPVPGAQGIK